MASVFIHSKLPAPSGCHRGSPLLSLLVTDMFETTDAWSQSPTSSECVRLFAHIHRSSTNSLCMETTESVQTVRVFSSF